MSETAEATWDAAVAGLNVLTPERIEVSYTTDGSLYELTKGSGMDGTTMYGVTVLTDSKIDTDRCELFNDGTATQRWLAAAAYVADLRGDSFAAREYIADKELLDE